MTKLYYDDPLQAAYMAREFGVKLEDENENRIEWVDGHGFVLFDSEDVVDFVGMGIETFYIHPDSYRIFEPQEGDRNIKGFVFEKGQWVIDGMIPAAMFSEVPREINHRDNKPFFWPKEEV